MIINTNIKNKKLSVGSNIKITHRQSQTRFMIADAFYYYLGFIEYAMICFFISFNWNQFNSFFDFIRNF